MNLACLGPLVRHFATTRYDELLEVLRHISERVFSEPETKLLASVELTVRRGIVTGRLAPPTQVGGIRSFEWCDLAAQPPRYCCIIDLPFHWYEGWLHSTFKVRPVHLVRVKPDKEDGAVVALSLGE
jgi:hypothetical protein